MRIVSVIFILLMIPSILASCQTSPGQNYGGILSKKQVLKQNPDADIFEFEDAVYIYLTGDTGDTWIDEVELTKEKQVGEITDGMATKLPIGAKIYAPKERRDILIVEYDGKEKRYLIVHGE